MRILHTVSAVLLCLLISFSAAAQMKISPPVSLGPYTIPAGTPAYIRNAINSPERTAADKARDSSRKPAQVLMMSGIKPGDHVIEIAGFGQYYTKMLSAIVGPKGKVDVYDLPYTERFAGKASRAFAAAHANVDYHQQDYNTTTFPGNVDEVFCILYYHDMIIQKIDTAKLNAKFLAALKPGGAYVIVDHKAKDGSGTTYTSKLHRIDVQVIKDQVTAAGFKLAEESNILAHPEDDRTKMVFDPSVRGITDRALFIFRKPK